MFVSALLYRCVRMGDNVFIFIPNLIGYARVVLALISFYFMPFDPIKATVFYLLSGLLDAFDGWAARTFNQSTSFGAVLDMVTDRCATTCLIMVLCYFYPSWIFVFQVIVALDISSHWIQMYSSLLHGETSHKTTDLNAHPVMRFYFMKPVLFTFCACNELFFAALYLHNFYSITQISAFGFSIGIWKALAILCFPISFIKQVVSVIALVVACMNIGALDVVARSRRRDQPHT